MSYAIGLAKVRRSEAFLACAAILEEYGLDHRLEFGKKHPRIIFNVGERELVHTLNWHCGEWNNAKNSSLQLRRMIQEAQRGEEEVCIQGSEAMPQMRAISILGTDVPVLEYKDQRVVTFAMVDAAHQRPAGTAGRTFRDNRRRFVEGKDFYAVDCAGLDVLRRDAPGVIGDEAKHAIVLTRRGYLKLVKPMSDDRAWDIQGEMVESYFAAEKLAQSAGMSREELVELVNSKLGSMERLSNLEAGHELIMERLIGLHNAVQALVPPLNQAAAVEYIHSSQVVSDLAEVPDQRRFGSLTAWVTRDLQRYCGRVGSAPKLIDTYPGHRWLFARQIAERWLMDGGRKAIWVRVNEHAIKRSGKTVVALKRHETAIS